MRYNLRKALLFLYILCLGILLTGAVVADDQNDETYGAYPGGPTSVPTPTPTPSVVQPTTSGAYPSGPIPAYPIQQTAVTTTTTSAGQTPTGTVTAVYYTQAPPVTQQNVLLTYNIQTAPPTAVYYSGALVPWTSFYQVFPANSPALWITSSAGWSWYATCPIGGWVQELIYVPATGTMKLYDLYPDGTTKYYSYGWTYPGYKYRWFNANMPGRYMTMLIVSDSPSNYITIDVA